MLPTLALGRLASLQDFQHGQFLDFLEFRVWNIERELLAGQLFAPDSEILNMALLDISGINMGETELKQWDIALENIGDT